MNNKLIIAAALSMTSLTAQAVEYPYIGVDYLSTTYTSSKYSGDAKVPAARLRFGSVLSTHFAAEAQLVSGLDGDPVDVPGNTYDVHVDGIFSANIVARMAFGQGGSAWVSGGYSYASFSADSNSPLFKDQSANDNGFSYGAGIAIKVWHDWQVEGDYTSFLDTSTNTLKAIGVGVRHDF